MDAIDATAALVRLQDALGALSDLLLLQRILPAEVDPAALARALSLETGILLMDEPFGALDEQTRMILGEDLSVLLSRSSKTIVFVTHSLGEAVFLADRVAVFSARPGTIKEIISIDEPHPRSEAFRLTQRFAAWANELSTALLDASTEVGAGEDVGTDGARP